MDGGIDPHRHLVGILGGNPFVHLEQVAVARLDDLDAEAVDGFLEVEIHRKPGVADAEPFVRLLLCGARRDVARHEVAEARVAPFEVVVALRVRDLIRRPRIALLLRHPDAAVIAQRLRHERQLRLMVAAHRDARRMNLREARIGEQRAALVRAPRRRHVRVHRVGRQVIDGAVAAGAKQHRLPFVALELARDEVARHDAARLSVGHDQVEHLAAREQRDRARVDLPQHRLVRAEQQLLAGLSARVERTRHLRAAERSVVEQPAVFARKRHAGRHALVDDVDAQLREPIDVRFARAIVAALHRVVEEAIDAVAVVPVILGRVDAALRGDAVRAARAVEDAEQLDAVALLAERRGSGRAREAGADDDDFVFAAVRRVDQLVFELPPLPLVRKGAARNLRNPAS